MGGGRNTIMDTDDTLQKAVRKAAARDHDAFRVVFDRVSDKVFRFLLSQTGDRDVALDLLQDMFIDLWKGLPTFTYRSDDEFWGFVFIIAKRKLFAYRSKEKRFPTLDVDDDMLDALLPPEMREDPAHEDYRVLHSAITKLSDNAREIISLRHWSDLSYKEIAVVAHISETAAKVRHHRAIAELESHLPPKYAQDEKTRFA